MGELPGALGTTGSLGLRLGQAIFAVSSLLFMCMSVDFYSFTAYCFLIMAMGLVVPWSSTLALVDTFSICVKRPVRPPGILSIVIVGDWVLSLLSLAASTSAASVTDLLLSSRDPFCTGKMCIRYQLAAAMAFLSWCLLFTSLLFNLWLLPSA
ncbi:UNVERIFIED_CONTAM: CASP-like protein 5C1 [Sesamum calycinum]|uniref:CASP-like protein n=2 Tax=Sesamum TaxID=4181 RepID=A0AAW2SYL5_9LAMI